MPNSGLISAVLSQKTPGIYSVSPDATVYEAIQKLAEYNVGALLVMSGEELKGIISERDYTRKVVLKGKSSRETKVSEILTSVVVTVTPKTSVNESMELMTKHRVRHLPVLDEGKVVGVVSIGDLVNWIITVQSQMIQQLTSYISGQY